MNNPIIYTNGIMSIPEHGRAVRVRSLTKTGRIQGVNTHARKTRVYDIRGELLYADKQPYIDIDEPAYVGKDTNWRINPTLVKIIQDWLKKKWSTLKAC